ncbi:MAG: hypothetical protein RIQ89_789 [Bacteroidota bacterium]|jgi:ribosomal protein L11 methyltransferase
MQYYKIAIAADSNQAEILTALLSNIDFEMFDEGPALLNAYIPEPSFNLDQLKEVLAAQAVNQFEITLMPDENWNSIWESNFEPVIIANQVYIHAPFHQPIEGIKFPILIEPKMSFGTGHHSTTSSIMELMLSNDFKDKIVTDMGCGSGILAILAEQMGAKVVLAIDHDNWAFENTLENALKNNCKKIIAKCGDAKLLLGTRADIFMANINRNIILHDLDHYLTTINSNGILLLSGFLEEDFETIKQAVELRNFTFENKLEHNGWLALQFKSLAS